MAQVLFSLSVLCVIGMLFMPASSSTRGKAIYGWLTQLGGAAGFTMLLEAKFPAWEEPQWHAGILWSLASWTLFIAGFIVAIRKPRKRDDVVA